MYGPKFTATAHLIHLVQLQLCLTLKDPLISESSIEIKIELNFYFRTLWYLRRFYEGL